MKRAFTLAEVLITLGIIGIVAAMTIPTLMANYQKSVIYTQFQKSYSLMSSAVTSLLSDNGGDLAGVFQNNDDLLNAFSSKFEVVKTCKIADDFQDCFHVNSTVKTIGGAALGGNWTSQTNSSMVLKNGVQIVFYENAYRYPACNGSIAVKNGENLACSIIGVDVNGNDGPNVFGRDILVLYLYRYGIVPDGIPMTDDYNRLCDPADTSNGNNGIACSGKMYMAGSMNF